MRVLILSIFVSFNLISSNFVSMVVYDQDDRIDASSFPIPFWKSQAKNVAIRIPKNSLRHHGHFYSIQTKSLRQEMKERGKNLCQDVRFAQEAVIGNCSGFLVEDDILATAGHCLQSFFSCENYYWVFGHNQKTPGQQLIPKENVYECEDIISTQLDKKQDFAIARLSRHVPSYTPVTLDYSYIPSRNRELVSIGSPDGLATKITTDGRYIKQVRRIKFFKAHIDSFEGNSGSPVYDFRNGNIVGILVGGERPDYSYNSRRQCYEVRTCDASCRTNEEVNHISSLKLFL